MRETRRPSARDLHPGNLVAAVVLLGVVHLPSRGREDVFLRQERTRVQRLLMAALATSSARIVLDPFPLASTS